MGLLSVDMALLVNKDVVAQDSRDNVEGNVVVTITKMTARAATKERQKRLPLDWPCRCFFFCFCWRRVSIVGRVEDAEIMQRMLCVICCNEGRKERSVVASVVVAIGTC